MRYRTARFQDPYLVSITGEGTLQLKKTIGFSSK